MVEWEQKLKDFPAYKKYETFNRKTITNEENNPCNDLYFDNEEAEKFCKQAVEILKELPRITDDKARNEECAYFQHWFSDTVRRKFSNKDRFFSNYDLSNYLFDVINTFNYDKYNKTPNKCYASRNAEYVKIEKDLHDYFINFDSISCKGLSKETCQMYYNYVQDILPLYKTRRERHLCCYLANGEVETKCKNYFKCDQKYDPKKLLKNLEKEMEIIDRYGQVDKSSWDELVAKYDAEQQSKYQYWYSYDPYTYDYYTPSQYSSINQSVYSSRKFHNGLIVTAVIGIFLGLFFYIKFNSAKIKRKRRRREEALSDYLNDIDNSCTSVSSMEDEESILSSTDADSLCLSYQSSQSSLQ